MTKCKPCCLNCDTAMHEVFYEDDIRRWRCMKCGRIYSEREWQVAEDEVVRKRHITREGAVK